MPVILEALVTTTAEDGSPHFAPMGPHVNREQSYFELRPYRTSQTHANLRRTARAVVHVTDDSALLARAAVGALESLPPTRRLSVPGFHVLEDCCRWFALEVSHWSGSDERPSAHCKIAASGRVRDFWGFCRAHHALIEAAILATRLHLISESTLRSEFARLRILVEKTGGSSELDTFGILEAHLARQLLPPAERH